MSRKKNTESSGSPGAPEWMVTFSDCMTLLLTFFVLLLSFSTIADKTYKDLKVIYSTYLPSIGLKTKTLREAVSSVDLIRYTDDRKIDEGAEKPSNDKGEEGILRNEQLSDMARHKVFVANSGDIFWANGKIISTSGKEILSTLGQLLKYLPNRVVISENGINKSKDRSLGLSRAYAIMNYLVKNHQIERNRFSIGADCTIEGSKVANLIRINEADENNRVLEITLLEWSICH